jgi:hypothetical protein
LSGSVANGPVTKTPAHASQVPGAFAAIKADETKSNLWGRPAPEVAAHNSRRSGFAWILRQLGPTEDQLNRLANLDIAGVLSELKQKASAGDAASINILGEIAYQNCRLGRDDATAKGYVDSQIRDVLAFPAIDSSWFSTVMRDDEAFYKKMYDACAHVDVDEALSWVKARADQGDGASLWLLSLFAGNMTEMQQRLRDAAVAGFPEAQFDLAWAILGNQEGAAGTGATKSTQGTSSDHRKSNCRVRNCSWRRPSTQAVMGSLWTWMRRSSMRGKRRNVARRLPSCTSDLMYSRVSWILMK